MGLHVIKEFLFNIFKGHLWIDLSFWVRNFLEKFVSKNLVPRDSLFGFKFEH